MKSLFKTKSNHKSNRKSKSIRKSANQKPYPIPKLNLNQLSKSELYKMYLKVGKAWEKLSGRSEDLGVISKDSSL